MKYTELRYTKESTKKGYHAADAELSEHLMKPVGCDILPATVTKVVLVPVALIVDDNHFFLRMETLLLNSPWISKW